MDFAKKQMEKYGWQEGRGLGKNEDGMSTALKPKLKFDNGGVGFELSKDFTNNWWENVYNKAAENVDVTLDTKQEQVKLKTKGDSVEITTKDYSIKDFKKNKKYGNFWKTEKMTQDGTERYKTAVVPELNKANVDQLSDEQLFEACGGRTAHKGARHGLHLSGKLARIEKQEKLLMKQLSKIHLSSPESERSNETQKKLEKLKKQKEIYEKSDREEHTPKKKKNSVSFNGTVVEFRPIVSYRQECTLSDESPPKRCSSPAPDSEIIEVSLKDEPTTASERLKRREKHEEYKKLKTVKASKKLLLGEPDDAVVKKKHKNKKRKIDELEGVSTQENGEEKMCKKDKKKKKKRKYKDLADKLKESCTISEDDN